LVDSDVVPEVGDIILYEEGYYEVDSIITNQYYMGKNPDYPNSPNPLNPDLDKFGYNVSIICQTHYVPADKVGITRERLI
jgi:signal peptidase I